MCYTCVAVLLCSDWGIVRPAYDAPTSPGFLFTLHIIFDFVRIVNGFSLFYSIYFDFSAPYPWGIWPASDWPELAPNSPKK